MKAKVIGLVPVRNEENIVIQSLAILSNYVDEMIVLDDASHDHTVTLLKEYAQDLHIAEIIESSESYWEHKRESDKRQALLDAGRRHGGTIFVLLDADEIFNASCLYSLDLPAKIRRLKPGQILYMPMVHVWKGSTHYRDDSSRWSPKNCLIGCAFGDTEYANYADNPKDSASGFIHMSRLPKNLPASVHPLFLIDVAYAIIHFRFANWENILVKRAWYMCLELIRSHDASLHKEGRTAQDINYFYTHNEPFDDTHAKFKEVPETWYAYPDFDVACFAAPVSWRKKQVEEWLRIYGIDFFKELDIWHINWHLPSN